MDKNTINGYVYDFKRIFSKFVKSGVTINTTACPYKNGVVIIFQFNTKQSDLFIIKPEEKTVLDIFEKERINNIISVGPNVDKNRIHFSGTNIANLGSRLILIKEDSPEEWGITAVVNDISKIIGKVGNNGRRE